ncbi:MAG: pentapeptide repeat-containing protein [Chitinivibrionales bacterium]|nr:pentapeptide repeat-containing protein [Chitinivibrionales bacterium]
MVQWLILILFCIVVALFLIGMIVPKLVLRWGSVRSRGCVFLNYGLAISICGILISVDTTSVKEIDPNSPASIELSEFQDFIGDTFTNLFQDHYDYILKYADGDEKFRKSSHELFEASEEMGGYFVLGNADFKGKNLNRMRFKKAQLGRANFQNAMLYNADFKNAFILYGNFRGAKLAYATFKGANLGEANFREAEMFFSDFEGANLSSANLEGTNLLNVNMRDADLQQAHLEGAKSTSKTDLRGADLTGAYLQGAQFLNPIVDGKTSLWECKIDRKTYFSGPLESIRIDPGTRQLMEYNMRRKNWEEWYKNHMIMQWPVRMFWWPSDYGISTIRLLGVFFGVVLLFANIYCMLGLGRNPEIVSNLFVTEKNEQIPKEIVPWRAIYFSLVTMTTLGFGDIRAQADKISGHILLSIQVIFGYFLLGALITRLAILFTAGGPAGSFS